MIPSHAAQLALSFTIAFLPVAWLPVPLLKKWIVVTTFLCLISQLHMLLRWSWRSRWAGRLLLDFSRPPSKGFQIRKRVLVSSLVLLSLAIWIDGNPVAVQRISYLGWMVVIIIQEVLQNGRQEVRQKGLMATGAFLPWPQIEGYRWERVDDGLQVLKLRLRKSIWNAPPLRVPIAAERKAEVDAALAQHFPGSETTLSL